MMTKILAVVLLSQIVAVNGRVQVTADQSVCLPSGACVPVSVIEAEFKGYEVGQPPPSLMWQQQILDANTQLAAALVRIDELQTQTAPLRAEANTQRLKSAQDALDAALATSCGKDLAWDKTQRKCLPKKKDGGW